MIPALRVLGTAAWQTGTHLTLAFFSNVCAVLLSLPLIVLLTVAARSSSLSVLPLGVVLLVGVLPNPALAGLQLASRSFEHTETPSIREQWRGIRRYWLPTLKAWTVGILASAVILLNVTVYPHIGSSRSPLHILAGPMEVIWLSVFIAWVAMHLYIFPLLLRQERPSLSMAYRNAAVIALGRPLFTLTLTVAWLLWLTLSATTGPAYVIGLALGAAIQQNALTSVLPSFGLRGRVPE